MKRIIKAFFDNEILSYLFFGAATTLVSILSRLIIYHISHQEILATVLANLIGILFAFLTNDTIVFKQERRNWSTRLAKFFLARLSTLGLDVLLTYIFVTTFPNFLTDYILNCDKKQPGCLRRSVAPFKNIDFTENIIKHNNQDLC